MFGRDVMQQMREQYPWLDMARPEHRALMEHAGMDQWRMMMGGPSGRRAQEEMERDMERRRRTIEMIREHPEMTFEEQEAQARRETERMERALYPERFRRTRRRQRPGAGRPGVRRGEIHQPHVTSGFIGPPEANEFEADIEQSERQTRIYDEAMQRITSGVPTAKDYEIRDRIAAKGVQRQQAMYDEQQIAKAQIQALRDSQFKALKLEEAGLKTHAKTQSAVAGLQFQIERLYGLHKSVDDNASNLLRRQQKTQQNNTGNP